MHYWVRYQYVVNSLYLNVGTTFPVAFCRSIFLEASLGGEPGNETKKKRIR